MSEGSRISDSALDSYIPIWIGLVAFVFYALTLKPAIGWGIDAEVARQSFDVPGTASAVDYPFRVLFGFGIGQLTWLFPARSHDLLQNLLSAFFSAASLSILYLICLNLEWRRESAVITCLTLGLSHLFWHLSVTSGPFPVSIFFLLLLIYVTLQCMRYESGPGWVAGTALLLGLGIGETPFFLLFLPGFVVLAISDRRFLRHWPSGLLFLLFLLVGYGGSLVLAGFLAGEIHVMDLLPFSPEWLQRLFDAGRFPDDFLSFGALFFYQFPLFGMLFGGLGLLLQVFRKRSIGWILLIPFVLSIPLHSSSLPDPMFYQSSLTFVVFSVWVGEGLGWFLGYAYRRREEMDSSYGALVTAVGIAMGLSPVMLYMSSGDLEEKNDSFLSSFVPERSFARMNRTSYYRNPWKMKNNGTKLLWRDTKSIPDGSVLIADPLAAAPIRYYMTLHDQKERFVLRNPKMDSYQSDPERTVRFWIRSVSKHDGTSKEPPKRGVYSLDSHPMYKHEQLRETFQFDQPLLIKKEPVSTKRGKRENTSNHVHVLNRVERSPIWRIRLSEDTD